MNADDIHEGRVILHCGLLRYEYSTLKHLLIHQLSAGTSRVQKEMVIAAPREEQFLCRLSREMN